MSKLHVHFLPAHVLAEELAGSVVIVIDLLRAKKILVTHGTGFNWFHSDHFRLVTLPSVEILEEAIGRIASYLESLRE